MCTTSGAGRRRSAGRSAAPAGRRATSTSRSDAGDHRDEAEDTSASGTRRLDLSRAPGRRCGAGRACETVAGHRHRRGGHALVVDHGRLRRGVGAGDPPQRVAQGDHGDAVREGQEPVEGVRHHGERDGDDAADGEERGGPAGEDAGPVQRDAEEEAADQVGEALDLDGPCCSSPDVTAGRCRGRPRR